MIDLSPLLDRILPSDATSAGVIAVCLLALAVVFMALRVVASAIHRRDRR